MITTDLRIREDRFKTYRDPTGYMFAKWYDEPFIVEILNEINFKDFKFTLANDADDRAHIDLYANNGNETITFDCKIMTHNFAYSNGSTDKRNNKSYVDVVTIAEPCLNCNTDYIMFVRRNEIIMSPLKDIRTRLKPLVVNENSKGLGGQVQTLFNFRAIDLRNMFSSIIVEIPKNKSDLHEEAAKRYEFVREIIRDIQFNRTLTDEKKYELKIKHLTEFKDDIIGFINRYNSIYVEIPHIVDTSSLLNDIYSL